MHINAIFRRHLATNTKRGIIPTNPSVFNTGLVDVDNELASLLDAETKRQRESLILIPSENFTSRAVRDALSSVLQNKYSEGYPGARYYGGNNFIDSVERLCQQRALTAFNLDPKVWGVNVQPLSGSPANFYVYSALLRPHDRIMGLDLPHGGHLSHGYQTPTKKISAVSTFYETFGYRVDPTTGIIDYDKLQDLVDYIRPKLLIAGASAYPRKIDFARMRQIADSVNAYLLADISHWSGMMAAGTMPSPFDYADIVSTTTHKTLRGPRAAMIFYQKNRQPRHYSGGETKVEDLINAAVFPGHQGGPHNHTIGALAVALKLAATPEFKEYQQQVLDNCQVLAACLQKHGVKLVSGGTDTHLVLLDLTDKKVDGAQVERVLEMINVAANKNTIPGDKSALKPSGLRIGTPAMTTRGFDSADFEWTADLISDTIELTAQIQSQVQSKNMASFKAAVTEDAFPTLSKLKQKVIDYVIRFPFYS